MLTLTRDDGYLLSTAPERLDNRSTWLMAGSSGRC